MNYSIEDTKWSGCLAVELDVAPCQVAFRMCNRLNFRSGAGKSAKVVRLVCAGFYTCLIWRCFQVLCGSGSCACVPPSSFLQPPSRTPGLGEVLGVVKAAIPRLSLQLTLNVLWLRAATSTDRSVNIGSVSSLLQFCPSIYGTTIALGRYCPIERVKRAESC